MMKSKRFEPIQEIASTSAKDLSRAMGDAGRKVADLEKQLEQLQKVRRSVADVATVWARTADGIRGFLVPRGTPGQMVQLLDWDEFCCYLDELRAARISHNRAEQISTR